MITEDEEESHDTNYSLEGKYFRIVDSEAGLIPLIDRHCGSIGFKINSAKLLDENAFGLFEIAQNIQRYENYFLTVHIFADNKRLFKKRKKVVERIMTTASLHKKQFVLQPYVEGNKLQCGGNGLWLRLEKMN